MATRKTNPEICEPSLVINDNVAQAFAEGDHGRVRLKQNPLIQQGATEKRHSPREFRAECLKTASATRPSERNRLRDFQGMLHKIRTLRTGFEVEEVK